MELDMDSRMARDEIDWFLRAGSGDLEIYCFGTPDGVLTRLLLDIQIWASSLSGLAGHGEQLIAISWAAPV